MGVTRLWKEWKITCQNGMEVYYVWEITDGLSKTDVLSRREKKKRGRPKIKCERQAKKSDEALDSKT
jgi:hypothetical protein